VLKKKIAASSWEKFYLALFFWLDKIIRKFYIRLLFWKGSTFRWVPEQSLQIQKNKKTCQFLFFSGRQRFVPDIFKYLERT
jgi:hypothetical protein